MFAEIVEKVKKSKLAYLPQYLQRVHFKIADVTRMIKCSRKVKNNVRQLKYQTKTDIKDMKLYWVKKIQHSDGTKIRKVK